MNVLDALYSSPSHSAYTGVNPCLHVTELYQCFELVVTDNKGKALKQPITVEESQLDDTIQTLGFSKDDFTPITREDLNAELYGYNDILDELAEGR